MKIQPTRGEPDMATAVPTADGGNRTLVNQDEDDILDRTVEGYNVRDGTESMWEQDDSHVMDVYRMPSM